jgi:hypothetical protein
VAAVVGRRPLLWFFLFACALSWPMALTGGVNPLAPALAALLVLGLIQGRQGLRLLLRRAVLWRVPARWYVVALLLPVLLLLGAVALTVATGAPMPTVEHSPTGRT